ncbi:MAG TPA: sigma-70 family RNA polymerase sigma factor [Solirubrobacteraceae bacterium]|jgi:RNA polymerase sigma-70 factor (ECF subfamily)|nr:sigma-70 family RNA polymerase sigma factor [Solirubrobacteraceae bacterium]
MPPVALPAGPRSENDDERALVAALRRGDETAFVTLVERYGASLVRLARTFVRDRAVAEEVVQETWLAVLNGIDRFEGRSSLRTWIFQILSNRAKTRAVRERRSAPFSSLASDGEDDAAAVDADRFRDESHRWAGHWAAAPSDWSHLPEERLLGQETLARVREAIERLPSRQADVIVLRDVEGWPPDEVCAALGISDGNQRILLHRARSKVRAALECYFAEGATG